VPAPGISFYVGEVLCVLRDEGRLEHATGATPEAVLSHRTAAAAVGLAAGSPMLGQHLAAAVRTGYFCSYTTDLRVRVDRCF
jgi:hypothetical protein